MYMHVHEFFTLSGLGRTTLSLRVRLFLSLSSFLTQKLFRYNILYICPKKN